MNPHAYIIGFNNQERVDRALASIPSGIPCTILDNGTVPLTVPTTDAECIRTGPGYFTHALTVGILDAMCEEAVPIVCNDDIELDPGCIDAMMKHIEAGAGIVCPIQVDMAVPDSVIMGGTMAAYPAGIHRTGHRQLFDGTEARDWPWLPFCVAAFHPSMVQEIGLPDANLRMWFSDSDYCIRARLAGWSVILEPGAVVRHEQSASVNEYRDDALNSAFVMDQAVFTRKWGGAILEEYS